MELSLKIGTSSWNDSQALRLSETHFDAIYEINVAERYCLEKLGSKKV
jgi:hypothetical protein